jgi:DNA modification methylase
MEPSIDIAGARVFLGDCRDVLKTLPDNSVDSIVTDPPYELGFMGKKWDSSGIAYDVTVWAECLRVLKPGGHVLAFGGSRTWHRLAVAVEDAGFELRDSIAWIYGSGFPKSLDVSKAIDKNLGAEREAVVEVCEDLLGVHENPKIVTRTGKEAGTYGAMTGVSPQTQASSSEAKAWQGWGTALKPAFEPVVVGRKPLVGTVAENVLAWGVGGLNIDASRIGNSGGTRDSDFDETSNRGRVAYNMAKGGGSELHVGKTEQLNQGRWPANVILDEVSAGLLDEQSGVSKSSSGKKQTPTTGSYSIGNYSGTGNVVGFDDRGGASRFFYVAKASKRDRNEGLEELEATSAGDMVDRVEGSAGMESPRAGAGRTSGAKNFHPTVKPTQLMRYLIKLVTPAGGTVLDPFTGSGSTGKAALLDGYQFIGAELTEEYLPIIEGRLKWASEQKGEDNDTLF